MHVIHHISYDIEVGDPQSEFSVFHSRSTFRRSTHRKMCESEFSGEYFHSYSGDYLHSITYFTDHDHLHLLNINKDMISHSCKEINNTPPFLNDDPSMDSDQSSGYLEDALFEFTSKRRRLTITHDDHHPQSCWDLDAPQAFENCASGYNSSTPCSQSKSSSNTHQLFFDRETLSSTDHVTGGMKEDKEKVIARVVYPFSLVKPGGFKGDMTLSDINERILMPPSRPVRHPVGDFACKSFVSLDRPGLSGKVVVALTKIYTHGRGMITIIRTKN